jgi:hypothetical protein
MRPQKNQDNKYAEGFEKEECIPKHIVGGVYEFPFKYCTHGEVDKIPHANEAVGHFPYPRYLIKYLQLTKILV